jgi:hypothetical protein
MRPIRILSLTLRRLVRILGAPTPPEWCGIVHD